MSSLYRGLPAPAGQPGSRQQQRGFSYEQDLQESDDDEQGAMGDGAAGLMPPPGQDLGRRRRPAPDDDESSSSSEDEGSQRGDGREGEDEQGLRGGDASSGEEQDEEQQDEEEGPRARGAKRRRTSHDGAGAAGADTFPSSSSAAAAADATADGSGRGRTAEPAGPVPVPVQAPDQVVGALQKITAHISNPAKFAKASGLLRQLLMGPALQRHHRAPAFEALRAAFSYFPNTGEPTLRREYTKLCVAADARPDLFGRAERAHLEVYYILGQTQAEMHTDDSFVFNKVLAKIKALVSDLPEAEGPQDDDTYELMVETWMVGAGGSEPPPPEPAPKPEPVPKPAAPEPPPVTEEGGDDADTADPFGLDALMAPKPPRKQPAAAETPAPAPAPAPSTTTTAWRGAALVCMRRQALMQCLDTARELHEKYAWARTSVELLVEHYRANAARFCRQQREIIDAAGGWVRAQRAARQRGPSDKEVRRDTTSFEQARAEWAKATVSTRGKVGGGGDAKSNNWLG